MRKTRLFIATAILSAAMSSAAFAGEWKQVGSDGAMIQSPLFDFGSGDFHVKYTKHEISTDYEGNPCVIVYYDYTNESDKAKSTMASGCNIKAWIINTQYLLGHDDIKTTLDTYTHFGYTDVKVDKLESYYNAVKMQSNQKIIPLKHA